MTGLLLISLTACANGRGEWAEKLQFHWRADLARWEISIVGLDQFIRQCHFEAGEADDFVDTEGEKAYITDAYFISLQKACKAHEKKA